MKSAFRRLLHGANASQVPPAVCSWERAPAAGGRVQRVLVCSPRSVPEAEFPPVLYWLHGAGHHPLDYFSHLGMAELLPLAASACMVFIEGGQTWYLDSPMRPESLEETGFLKAAAQVEVHHGAGGSREKRAICGFSMGGFGALYLASRHPEMFASASSILGPLDIEQLWPDHPALSRLLGQDRQVWRDHNPSAHTADLQGVQLLVTTGADAWDRPMNEAFVSACREAGVAVTYRTAPGGHDIAFVAKHLREHLEFHLGCFVGVRENPLRPWFIRPAQLADSDALYRNCFHHRGRAGMFRHMEWVAAETAKGRHRHLVVDMGEAVASGELSVLGDEGEIANVVVAPALRGRRLGSTLLQKLESEAKAMGLRTLTIGVKSSDTRVRGLYERHGFSFTRDTRILLGDEYTLVTYLQKSLDSEEK
jgi:S-formylglutathione hydrolase FrmB/N-acetylglutamate synthase-like GNAT family acetyltransferase